MTTPTPDAGHATYPGDARSIIGELHGPTLHGKVLVAVTADYDPAADRTRVGFAFARRPR